ncbi:Protein phosphatase 2C family protein [Candida albicans]|uniref:Protein phosphatase n=1 Tax=Candida albicans TaxID=5476 RepID=A0A8H6BZ57_CANAX|nr:Protein phosphatase 2C family protein [Candida albicans]
MLSSARKILLQSPKQLTTLIRPTNSFIIKRRNYSGSSIFKGARNYFLGFRNNSEDSQINNNNNNNNNNSSMHYDSVDESIPYVKYPLFTKEQLKKIATDKFKLQVGHASFGYHSDSIVPSINSLSDLTDPTSLNSLLPRRRPQGSPSDTLSIKAGDDTMLVSPSVIAVADGVSGWESDGITSSSDDSYLHTSHLMDLQKLNGSSTLILGMLNGDLLSIVSIGDSKIFIIRDGEIVLTNEEQTKAGLCPEQIGTHTLDHLPSDIAWIKSFKLMEGDYILMCSDGISDNLYEWEILNYLNEWINTKRNNNNNNNVKNIASKLLIKAKEVAFDDYAYTPYNEKVNSLNNTNGGSNGTNHSQGGKVDDMSVIIAKVELNKKDNTKLVIN